MVATDHRCEKRGKEIVWKGRKRKGKDQEVVGKSIKFKNCKKINSVLVNKQHVNGTGTSGSEGDNAVKKNELEM